MEGRAAGIGQELPAPEAVPAEDPAAGVLRRALRQRITLVGLGLAGAFTLIALIGPFLAPHSPSELVAPPYSPPSSEAPLGTDYLGQDVLSRFLWGGRSVIWMALVATALGVATGIAIGLVAGYSRTSLDDYLMSATDAVLSFPQIVLVLVFVSMLGPKLWLIVLIVAVSHAPRVARLTRGIARETVELDFVQAAEAIGVPRWRILSQEVLPNLTTPLLVEFGIRLSWSIALIAALSFLGFGIEAPNADWGLMINENRNGLSLQPWAVIVPAIGIAGLTVGVNLASDGVSRALARVEPGSAR